MGQISRTIQMLATAALSTGAMVLATGCADKPPTTQANAIRGDVTDIRPMATATPASYQPPAYDTTGLIPTAPQAVTNEATASPIASQIDASGPMISTNPTGKTMGEKTHTVRKGETLFSIAKNVYGSGKAWNRIVSANPGLSPSKLKVGQVLVLPA